MTLQLNEVFFIYLAVFLAVIFTSWFLFTRRRYRWENGDRRIFICSICGSEIPSPGPSLKLHCRACGALLDRLELQKQQPAQPFCPTTNQQDK